MIRRTAAALTISVGLTAISWYAPVDTVGAFTGIVDAGAVVRIAVPEAVGGKTVVGQLTVDRVRDAGFVTAYPCDDGPPRDPQGRSTRSDLNFDGRVSPVASNRLLVEADDDGDVCIISSRPAAIVVDVNATSFDDGVTSFPNRRTDTRLGNQPTVVGGGVVRIAVPEAVGGKTVVGQLTVDRVRDAGFVTAYPCDDGPPRDSQGRLTRSDLNFDGRVTTVASNRLLVAADADGEICLTPSRSAALVVDINGVAGGGVTALVPRRIDTRTTSESVRSAGSVLRIAVPEATAGSTVLGQLTVDRVREPGFLTAYGCADGVPTTAGGAIARSDVNFDGRVNPVASNRLVVEADRFGEICIFTSRPAAIVVDITGVSRTGIQSFPNRRSDSRVPATPDPPPAPVVHPSTPSWPSFTPLAPWFGVSALTGLPVSDAIARRPVLVAKIDNFPRARPQWGLEHADVVFELNVEGLTRFMALFHTTLPDTIGPIRSARTGDFELLEAMNRPVFAYSGANPGVTDWIRSAAGSGVIVDHSGQRRPCYRRTDTRPGPHNLQLDGRCAIDVSAAAGAARPLWAIASATSVPPVSGSPSPAFTVAMDGVTVDWAWDETNGRYLRHQNGEPHLADSGVQIGAVNVVVIEAVHEPSAVDARSPHPVLTGSGSGTVHRGGRAIPITWERAREADAFRFRSAADGSALSIGVGTTFVHIARPR